MAIISIIIPTYNAEQYIERSVRSLFQQQSNVFEIIILDSFSTDRTIDIINSVKSDKHEVRVIREKDKGIYDAMNRGIELARGGVALFYGL